jgi:hypothetical protein
MNAGLAESDSRLVKVKILEDGYSLDQILQCLNKKEIVFEIENTGNQNLSRSTILKKGQIIKFAFARHPSYHWRVQYQYDMLSVSAENSHKLNMNSHDVLTSHRNDLSENLDLVLAFGIKISKATIERVSGSDHPRSDTGFVGSVRFNYKLASSLKTYIAYELDRYLVLGDTHLNTPSYAFVFKHNYVAGIKLALSNHFALSVDGGGIMPAKNTVGNIQSGTQVAAQVDYEEDRFNIGYRFQRFNIKTNEYDDSAGLHSLRVGYSF